jgi:hypothetical protein
MDQTAAILRHLRAGHELTPIEAFERFGCLRLAARISDLRRDGYAIETRIEKGKGKRLGRLPTVRSRTAQLFTCAEAAL